MSWSGYAFGDLFVCRIEIVKRAVVHRFDTLQAVPVRVLSNRIQNTS